MKTIVSILLAVLMLVALMPHAALAEDEKAPDWTGLWADAEFDRASFMILNDNEGWSDDLMGTEPIIPAAWDILYPRLHAYLSDPEGIARGDHQAIADIFEGLTMSGFAMQAARSSRPASCCEHLFSHILDMTHHRFHGKLQSHGIQVAVGTLTMCAIFDELFKFDLTKLDVDACVAAWPTIDEEQMRALEIFRTFPAPKLGYTEITKFIVALI